MNLPDSLTISRFFLAAALTALLAIPFPHAFGLALLVFVLGGITDFLDGWLARNVYGVSEFGKLMDPLADKVMVCAALVSLAALTYPPGAQHQTTATRAVLAPAWCVVLILSREFAVTGLRQLAACKGHVLAADAWGKAKMVVQTAGIGVILLCLYARADFLRSLPWPAQRIDHILPRLTQGVTVSITLITLYSGWRCFLRNRDLFVRPASIKG